MAAVTSRVATTTDELSHEIAEAQAELSTAIDRAGLRNDAYGAVLRAQSQHLSVLHGILAAFQRDLVSAQPRFDAPAMRTLAQELRPELLDLLHHMRLRTIAAVLGVLVAGAAAMFGAGWLLHGPTVNEVWLKPAAGDERCDPPRDGGQICWAPHLVALPTAQERMPK
jgi:hypothetical protein